MYSLEYLQKEATNIQAEINGKWVSARPIKRPLWNQIKDAWEVLINRADAFKWPEGQ